MSDIITPVVVAILGSKALELIIQYFVKRAEEKSKKPTSLETAIRLLLQDRLEHLCTKAIQMGKTTRREKSFLVQCYNAYEHLGGNGDIDFVWDDYMELPVEY